MVNLGLKPYTAWIKSHRGKKLANAFKKYDEKILSSYSETANFVDYEKEKEINNAIRKNKGDKFK